MKYYLILVFSFYSINVLSQSKEISFEDKLLIGELKKDKPKLLIDKQQLIATINKEFFKKKSVIDQIKIIEEFTLGGKKIKYYYAEFSSSERKDLHIVRWLCNYDGLLYFDKSNNPDRYTYVDLFITCEGNEKCRPRLFYIGEDDFGWSCREFIGCVTEEEALINKCKQGNGAF